MKTRIIVHKAYNKHFLTGVLIEIAGTFIPFQYLSADWLRRKSAAYLLNHGFIPMPSVAYWKNAERRDHSAYRFERVTILGETTQGARGG